VSDGPAFPVSPEKARALRERLARLGITEEDLDEHFVTSGGKGGQNVNKVATCVVLRHAASGTLVKCQSARTQGLNRYLARKLLAEKIETERLGRLSAREQEVARVRRQKRRRSRRAKARMLADKHARAAIKGLRAPVSRDRDDG
jgi:protein subunit release factor B